MYVSIQEVFDGSLKMAFNFYKGKQGVFCLKFRLLGFKYLGKKSVGHRETGVCVWIIEILSLPVKVFH